MCLLTAFSVMNSRAAIAALERPSGIIVGVGVLLDTLLVRSLLVPALSLDVGARTWWPGRLVRHRPSALPVPAVAPRP